MPTLRSLDLFSGCGGLTHGLRGGIAHPVMYCERDEHAIATLNALMAKGCLPRAPVHDDVATLDGKKLRGKIDIIVGGFPCFPAGTPVLTDRGYMPIENVTGEEKLLTHTGSWKPIENLQRKLFSERMACVTAKHHAPIQCTDNHPFYARTQENTKPDWVPARDLTADHYVGIPALHKGNAPADLIDNGYVWYAVTDVTFSQVDDPVWVYNFQVEDDHSYVVQNIVVKNCTGWSTAGLRQGFENEGSGLFAHVVRLVSEVQPPLVFLENVAAICETNGLDGVLSALGNRGYHVWWMVMPASAVGAPHLRRRWWCLAVKKEAVGMKIKSTIKWKPFDWTKEPVPRMVLNPVANQNKRLGMLGNSVVPDVVRTAFLMLWSGKNTFDVHTMSQWTLTLPTQGKPIPAGAKRLYGAYLRTGRNVCLRSIDPPVVPERTAVNLTLDPNGLPPPADDYNGGNITTGVVQGPVSMSSWATPRYGCTSAARQLTMRCKNDLPTQIRFEKRTPRKLRLGLSNPQFVEWIMGYPTDWTKSE